MKFTIMAEITKKENRAEATAEDYRNLAKITRDRKMKNGIGGYSEVQIRNFYLHGHKCSPEMKTLILDFLKNKPVTV